MGSFTGSARKVSPPTPTYMSEEQQLSYLSNLRSNRPTRPTGSRPAPFKSNTLGLSTVTNGPLARSDSAPVFPQRGEVAEALETENPGMIKSTSFSSSTTRKGRPLAQAPSQQGPLLKGRKVSPTATIHHYDALPEDYRESTARKLEKEEAHTLREALHIIDKRSEEQIVFEAAQKEAADLVWRHRNPRAAEDEKTAPYINPELAGGKSYGPELSQVKGPNQVSRNVSDGSASSQDNQGSRSTKRLSKAKDRVLSDALKDLQLASEERAAAIITAARSERRRSSGKRVTSNGSNRGLFRNPEDQIYEEPDPLETNLATNDRATLPLKARTRNSLPRGSRPLPTKPGIDLTETTPRINRVEIHKNPPTQSRQAAYTTNTAALGSTQDPIEEVDTPKSAALEIRGEDIRAATSMKKKDRSPKLPTPVAVSDQLGRPIVSFDPGWKPSSNSPHNSQDISRPVTKLTESPRNSKDFSRPLPQPIPSVAEPINSAPAIPTINFPDEDSGIPSINVEDDATPNIAVSPAFDCPKAEQKSQSAVRPLPKHSSTTPTKLPSTRNSRLPWLNGGTSSAPTVSCSSCSLPISGRIVTASGSSTSTSLRARFHPKCFACHHCSTALECVSFYPEPDEKRASRLEEEGIPADTIGAEGIDVRFYCHLDFHELFSPRCRSCKTPIEGEVVVAAGGEYHVGHFWCAECGDPFDNHTPFVEHNKYAYCVRCHTKRTSAKCRGCKKAILDEVSLEALGGKWHEACFVCAECGGGFGADDGRFFVREVEGELTEKERRKGVSRVEERGVCVSCEGRRLKA